MDETQCRVKYAKAEIATEKAKIKPKLLFFVARFIHVLAVAVYLLLAGRACCFKLTFTPSLSLPRIIIGAGFSCARINRY